MLEWVVCGAAAAQWALRLADSRTSLNAGSQRRWELGKQAQLVKVAGLAAALCMAA